MKISKTVLAVLFLVLLAGALRVMAAASVDIGTDEMLYTVLPYNIISAQRISTSEQAPLYFYLVDLGYRLWGEITLISGRLPSIIFGAFAVVLVFLIAEKLFRDRKAALVSAFFAAVSGYAIRFSQEMDMTSYFFALFSMFFFLLFLEQQKSSHLYLSVLLFALGVMAKPIMLLFAPAYALAWLWRWWQEKKVKGEVKSEAKTESSEKEKSQGTEKKTSSLQRQLLLSALLFLLVISPIFVYNYLLYTDKGFTDYYFNVLVGIGDQSSANPYFGQEAESWSPARLGSVLKSVFGNILRYDALLLLLGIMGIAVAWRTKENRQKSQEQKEQEQNYGDNYRYNYGGILFCISALFLVLYLAGKMGSPTHYIWILLVLSIFSGKGAVTIANALAQIAQKMPSSRSLLSSRGVMVIIIVLGLLSPLIVWRDVKDLNSSSITYALKEYAVKEIPDDAIIVFDPRIYRGIYAWSLTGKNYLEGAAFAQVSQAMDRIPGEKITVPFYYIECGPGTNCGWKPEDFNFIYQYGKGLTDSITSQTVKAAEIKAIDTFYVHKGQLTVPSGIYDIIGRSNFFWFIPVGWKHPELSPDYYTLDNAAEKFLNGFALLILYAGVAAAVLSLPWALFLLWRRSG